MTNADVLPPRTKIPVEETWDVESVFPNRNAWEKAFKEAEETLPEIRAYDGRLGEGPETLLEFSKTAEDLGERVGKLYVYANANWAVDANDQQAAADRDKITGLRARTGAALAFAEPEIMGIGFDTLRDWMEQEDELKQYEHYFERLEERAEHIRSAEVEELLSAVEDPFKTADATHGILANADLTFEPARDAQGNKVELSHSSKNKLLSSRDRQLRRTAWENYADAHLALKNTMANCLSAGVKQKVFIAGARGYESALEAALAPNFIPLDVYHSMISTYKANLPTWHRYWELRRRALGVEKLQVYDTRAALTEKMPDLSFEQAFEWIREGMEPLGEEYVSAMEKGVLEQRWVDKFPNKGKRFGAFSSGVQGTHPFIMMSFNDDIFGLSTLAHELGHSMHSYFTWKTQPPIYANYGLFLAEVASNFNQALVRAHLLETQSDPDLQIAIIEEAMANFHRYFFIMPTLARFELETHERVERGEALTADSMMALMADLFSEGYGPEMEVDRERVGSVWMQFSTHLYYNFYVYQYATGISAAHALAQGILDGADGARQNYLEFLKAGGSKFPLETLKMAGVDMTTPEPVEKTFGVLADYVERLEGLVG